MKKINEYHPQIIFDFNRKETAKMVVMNIHLIKNNYYEMIDSLGQDVVNKILESQLQVLWNTIITNKGRVDMWNEVLDDLKRFSELFV